MDTWYWRDFIAGWAGGVAGLLVGHPADTIKVRQQAFASRTGVLKSLKTTIQYEGVSGLYKGLSFPLLSAGVLNAIFFGVYGNALRYLEKCQYGDCDRKKNCDAEGSASKSQSWYLNVFLAGCIGGLPATLVNCPVDVIKIQMQAQTGSGCKEWGVQNKNKPQHTGVLHCTRALYQKHGARGFYIGFIPMLVRDFASYGVYMLMYETGVKHSSWNHILTTIVSGGTAGAVSWMLISPIDVVKSRIQADNFYNPTYKGIFDCTARSYREHGIPVFFRGFSMMMIRSFPVNAATFLVYEWCLKVSDPTSPRNRDLPE